MVQSMASIIEKSTRATVPLRCRAQRLAAAMKAISRPHMGSSHARPTRGGTFGWRFSPANPA